MRISSNQVFNRGLDTMLRQQAELLRLQQQLSSTKKVQYPSDDPIAAAKIDLMTQRINFGESLQSNRENAQGTLAYEESVLNNTAGVLQRVRELQVQAANGAMTESDRKAIGEEINVLRDQLQALANTQDSNGYYIFSGGQTASQTITRDISGAYIYNGDQTQRFQAVSSGLQVALNDNGADLFMRLPNGNGRFSVSETAVPNTGTAAVTSGTVVDEGSYVEDNYTLQFALNTQNQVVVMVSGAVSGNVIPPTGLPDDAPVYTPGMAVNFNGLEVTLTGAPNAGDAFTIAPSVNESVFTTLTRMLDNLNRPFATANDKARVQTENNQLLDQIDTALGNMLDFQAQVGARLNQLDVAEHINGDLIDISKETRSQLQDANLEEVAVALKLQMIYLQAAQQSFANIQGLTAFNFI